MKSRTADHHAGNIINIFDNNLKMFDNRRCDLGDQSVQPWLIDMVIAP